jgi:molybdopterin synthase sulfur carrier subunit
MIIKVFGQLTDVVGSDIINVDDIADTDALIKNLQSKYPVLTNSKYRVAVNRNIIQSNTVVQHDAEVALLPPFSGG